MTYSPRTYNYSLHWFDDEPEYFDVEAKSIKRAARCVYREWHRSGFEGAVVVSADHGQVVDLNLNAPTFDEAARFDQGGRPIS